MLLALSTETGYRSNAWVFQRSNGLPSCVYRVIQKYFCKHLWWIPHSKGWKIKVHKQMGSMIRNRVSSFTRWWEKNSSLAQWFVGVAQLVRAPAREARDPGSNPGPGENFLVKLTTQNLPDVHSENQIFTWPPVWLFFSRSHPPLPPCYLGHSAYTPGPFY